MFVCVRLFGSSEWKTALPLEKLGAMRRAFGKSPKTMIP
jgi:hypothetical protein